MSDTLKKAPFPDENRQNRLSEQTYPDASSLSQDAFFSNDFFKPSDISPAPSLPDPVEAFPDPFAQNFGTPSAPRKSTEGNTASDNFSTPAAPNKKR